MGDKEKGAKALTDLATVLFDRFGLTGLAVVLLGLLLLLLMFPNGRSILHRWLELRSEERKHALEQERLSKEFETKVRLYKAGTARPLSAGKEEQS